MQFTLVVEEAELNLIGTALALVPAALIAKLQQQVNAQLQSMNTTNKPEDRQPEPAPSVGPQEQVRESEGRPYQVPKCRVL